jgi:hypothetical protein
LNEVLGGKIADLFPEADFIDLVWSDAENGVISVKGLGAISSMGAYQSMKNIKIMNRIYRALEEINVKIGKS